MESLSEAILRQQVLRRITTYKALAKRIGVSLPALRAVLTHSRQPNRRTYPLYARFLQIDESEVREMAIYDGSMPSVHQHGTRRRLPRVRGSADKTATPEDLTDLHDLAIAAVQRAQQAAFHRLLGPIPLWTIKIMRTFSEESLQDLGAMLYDYKLLDGPDRVELSKFLNRIRKQRRVRGEPRSSSGRESELINRVRTRRHRLPIAVRSRS